MKRTALAVALIAATYAGVHAQQVRVDAGLTPYQKTSGISGSLSSIGSDTMNNMMTLWAEEFRKMYPNVRIQVEGKGSSTAPPALISATSQFGPMSRQMRATEIDQFQLKHGYKPTELRTSHDALAVYVHRDNPITKLTLAQVEAIFGKSRRPARTMVATATAVTRRAPIVRMRCGSALGSVIIALMTSS
jgi:phosphate transport system substrate-binding protein